MPSIKVMHVYEKPAVRQIIKPLFGALEKAHPRTKPMRQYAKDAPQSDGGNGGGIVVGTIFILGGIVVYFYIWWIAVFLIVLGIICIVKGATGIGRHARRLKKIEDEERENKKEEKIKQEKSNVIYLKNGSMIRGQIIEEIPNETIKIQTADGSIFVYKMDEVLKITHETK